LYRAPAHIGNRSSTISGIFVQGFGQPDDCATDTAFARSDWLAHVEERFAARSDARFPTHALGAGERVSSQGAGNGHSVRW
jgi:hypothetical protein